MQIDCNRNPEVNRHVLSSVLDQWPLPDIPAVILTCATRKAVSGHMLGVFLHISEWNTMDSFHRVVFCVFGAQKCSSVLTKGKKLAEEMSNIVTVLFEVLAW